ncbi:ADP-forming succinate--CoA ligase subunit beta [Desulfurispirillum indicum]|uniref:Succinate--CoA ligase [ADP-forming] subunit beta n=1 Tax=Desulfurispirillum indicum (strain ATCC BAA-1389 / DSM 22839 / S5) TaxID=653733 RepID=E6W6Q9_DESIS|nr:ADP-forming succinate--CoA ligase subunit beta [Desulfurispirillum indicum]ADU65059.1 succinyl-CoA synthetase, beta subunit [Desulfurispirillum indicum S5]UCZ56967.1 ADP-forming succinate--CoA ligase subunit beta [Desulfurispirillum indicum]
MNIHEYQGKELFEQYGIPVPKGKVAYTNWQAEDITRSLGGKSVVKVQIHAGNRGASGGVKLVSSSKEAKDLAEHFFNTPIKTAQTGGKSKQVRRILVEEQRVINKEFYLSMIVDREERRIAIIASTEGGVNIEEVAEQHPEKILMEHIELSIGILDFQIRKLAFSLGLAGEQIRQFSTIVKGLYKLFTEKDCSQIEINPLIVTDDGSLLALDAKVNFDENALMRHPEILELRDFAEEDPLEVEASRYNLSYIALDGTIGCMVNGAGLAMATMDIIQHYGGEPANFLDVGGGANTEKVSNAFSIILRDEKVKAILVNIFGGIMKCDIIAQGVVEAAKTMDVKVPIIIRLAGTNLEEGMKVIEQSGQNLIVAKTLEEAAKLAVEKARGGVA